MKWRPFQHEGKVYDLAHLDPFRWSYNIPAAANHPERAYKVNITFSSHCFTRNQKDGEQVPSTLWYRTPVEERVFCFDRYELTHLLPEIIKSLDKKQCYIATRRSANFFVIELPEVDGKTAEYEIYFSVGRVQQQRGLLYLEVKSAYVRTKDYRSTQPKKNKVGLKVILHNRQMGKPVKARR